MIIRRKAVFPGRLFDPLMIKIVYDNRRRVKWPLHAVIIGHIVQANFSGIASQLLIQQFPIGGVSFLINLLIQRQELWIFFLDVAEDVCL